MKRRSKERQIPVFPADEENGNAGQARVKMVDGGRRRDSARPRQGGRGTARREGNAAWPLSDEPAAGTAALVLENLAGIFCTSALNFFTHLKPTRKCEGGTDYATNDEYNAAETRSSVREGGANRRYGGEIQRIIGRLFSKKKTEVV